ncbi:hypothetical protein NP511_06360 [Natrinema thermotolerans]|uniref:Uncharacterized protein n=1 Tax=Natrinema thermotolerans TaxID=121872 RepID=A0AAF0PF09_9EURY|nr:hypothetical protein [Natrinema thermotolerans]WMT09254.1 hypothetical protein NP511_06360 [Natrinema thermotolerans]
MKGSSGKNKVSRRRVLQKTTSGAVGAGIGLNTLLGTVSAKETTREDLKRLEEASAVKKILNELNVQSLPEPERVEKRHAAADGKLTNGELEAWRIPVRNYGTLTAMEYSDKIGALFTFDPDLSQTPSGYVMAKEENAALGVSGSEVVFSRNATKNEQQLVLSALDIDGEIDGVKIEAKTIFGGFHASIGIKGPDDENPKIREFAIEIDGFDPRTEVLSDIDDDVSPLLISEPAAQEVSTQGIGPIPGPKDILKDVIQDWIIGTFASESLDYLGVECNVTCPDCVLYIVDVVGSCRSCIPLCSSGATGIGAITCVACFYLFCNDALAQADCLACLVCLYKGEEPNTPNTNAMRWVLDEIENVPSNPL